MGDYQYMWYLYYKGSVLKQYTYLVIIYKDLLYVCFVFGRMSNALPSTFLP